ncbi:MAG: preprotein translocase subunit SecE [Acidobacteriota bacterium]
MKILEWFKRFPQFLREVRMEVKKTSFPGRNEVINTTFVILVVVVIFGVYLWLVDTVVWALLQQVFKLFK